MRIKNHLLRQPPKYPDKLMDKNIQPSADGKKTITKEKKL